MLTAIEKAKNYFIASIKNVEHPFSVGDGAVMNEVARFLKDKDVVLMYGIGGSASSECIVVVKQDPEECEDIVKKGQEAHEAYLKNRDEEMEAWKKDHPIEKI